MLFLIEIIFPGPRFTNKQKVLSIFILFFFIKLKKILDIFSDLFNESIFLL